MRTVSIIISQELDGRKVRSILQYRLHIPAGMIASIKLRETGICLNGERCRTTDTVHTGDVLCAEVGDIPEETGIIPMKTDLTIPYEDEDLLVLDKPAGMATHGKAEKGDITVANALAYYWGTEQAFHPVNRLDRGTSGLMVVAKSGFAHERLRTILHTDAFVREYLAIVSGQPPEPYGNILFPIRKDGTEKRFVVAADGSPAHTYYEVVEQTALCSLVRLRLYTGRTHQIRVHMAALGCPIIGDERYGVRSEQIVRPALHSASLSLEQPITGKMIQLDSKLPVDMEQLWKNMKSK